MKKLTVTLLIVMPLVTFYLLGPRVEEANLNAPIVEPTANLEELATYIKLEEEANEAIKPDNESRIIWADSIPKKTEYSFVYLHGWSASYAEGDPLHKEIAKRYGANLYLPRLAGHGLSEEEPMLDLTATELMKSARHAVAVGKQLGEKVILLTTSTGGTLGLYLASQDPQIAGLILYSPNVDMRDPASKLLNMPWGLEIARLVKDSKYHEWQLDSVRELYWTNKYRLEALTHLREMVDETMTEEVFEKVTQPVFLGYYYKDEENQDDVVSVDAMLQMYEQLGTPDDKKEEVAFPEVGHHVIGSDLTSNDLDAVRHETFEFLEGVVGLLPIADDTVLD